MSLLVLMTIVAGFAWLLRSQVLSANREVTRCADEQLTSYPVYQSVHIYKGALIGLVSGYARPLTAGDKFGGIAYEECDNTSGASGAENVKVFRAGIFKYAVSGIAITDVGKSVFASADDTLTFTAGANSPAGVVRDYDSSGYGLIEIGQGPLILGAPLNFAGVAPGTETTGSIITTGSVWLSHTAVGGCAVKLLCANAAASGDYATLRIRARADAAGATVGINSSASGGANDYGNLFGVQGLAQPNAYTQSGGDNIVCGVYSCVDKTGTSSGRVWSMWIDDHSTTAKATGGHYLLRMSQNALGGTPVDIDGAITIQASRLPVLFNIETADGFLSDTSLSLSAQAGALKVKTPAGTRYIPLYSS